MLHRFVAKKLAESSKILKKEGFKIELKFKRRITLILTLLMVLLLFTTSLAVASNHQQIFSELESRYNAEIMYGDFSAKVDKRDDLQYDYVLDQNVLDQAADNFRRAFEKYPDDFMDHARANRFILTKNLRYYYDGVYRRIGGLATQNDLYISLDSIRYSYTTIHHELLHSFDLAYDGTFQDPDWEKLNYPKYPGGFDYGDGGAAALGNSFNHKFYPLEGFIQGYGTSAVEEDKAVTFEYMMVESNYQRMEPKLEKDSVLVAKIDYLEDFLQDMMPDFSWPDFHLDQIIEYFIERYQDEIRVERAFLNEQEDIIDNSRYVSMDASLMDRLGLELGQQIRLRVKDAEDKYGMYTIVEARDEGDNIIRMGLSGRQRLNQGDPFTAYLKKSVVATELSRKEEAAEYDQLVESLDDYAGNRDLVAIAPHGGIIQNFTDIQSDYLALDDYLDDYGVSVWNVYGYQGNLGAFDAWHNSSNDLSELSFPKLNQIIDRGFKFAVSFHGHAADGHQVRIGGLNDYTLSNGQALKERIKDLIIEKSNGQIEVVLFSGSSSDNVVNRLASHDRGGYGGVQILSSMAAREDYRFDIVNAVAKGFSEALAEEKAEEISSDSGLEIVGINVEKALYSLDLHHVVDDSNLCTIDSDLMRNLGLEVGDEIKIKDSSLNQSARYTIAEAREEGDNIVRIGLTGRRRIGQDDPFRGYIVVE